MRQALPNATATCQYTALSHKLFHTPRTTLSQKTLSQHCQTHTQNIATHNSLTHTNLSHRTLSVKLFHTQHCHRQLCQTQRCHTHTHLSHTHPFSHNIRTHLESSFSFPFCLRRLLSISSPSHFSDQFRTYWKTLACGDIWSLNSCLPSSASISSAAAAS